MIFVFILQTEKRHIYRYTNSALENVIAESHTAKNNSYISDANSNLKNNLINKQN